MERLLVQANTGVGLEVFRAFQKFMTTEHAIALLLFILDCRVCPRPVWRSVMNLFFEGGFFLIAQNFELQSDLPLDKLRQEVTRFQLLFHFIS